MAVRVQLGASPASTENVVKEATLKQLYRFLNPITGGPDGKGWPFGRDLFVADVYQCLQEVPGIHFIRQVELFVPGGDREPVGDPVGPDQPVAVDDHSVVASAIHEVEFIR